MRDDVRLPREISSHWFAASCFLPFLCLVILATDPARLVVVLAVALVGIPLADVVIGRRRAAPSSHGFVPFIVVVALAAHVSAALWAAWIAAEMAVDGDLVVLALSVGVCSGFGLNVAHTCCHDRGRALRVAGQVMNLLCAQLQAPHEHRLHHATYGTLLDPATARLGESVYAFAARYLVGAVRVVWRSESKRLASVSMSKRVFSHHGIRALLLPTVSLIAVALTTNESVVLFGLLHGAAAVFMTVLGNYVAHYGLVRRMSSGGKLEQGAARHSWNDNHAASKFVLLGLPEHSDHHDHPSRPSWESQSEASAPALPLPYSWMVLASLVPPIFRRVMDPCARAWTQAPSARKKYEQALQHAV